MEHSLHEPNIEYEKLEAFNKQIEKYCSNIDDIVFLKVNQMTSQGSINENGVYLPKDASVLIPPNIRVNFNLILNYYCNSQQSIQNMRIDDFSCCS